MNRSIHVIAAFAAAVLGLAWLAAPPPDPKATTGPRIVAGDPLFFDLELRDGTGAVVLNPRVVAEAGRPARIELASVPPELVGDHAAEPAPMCIVLDPLGAEGGLDMSIDVEVAGAPAQRARLRMPIGERQSVAFEGRGGQSFELSLLAYRMDTPEFERYVETLKRRLRAARTPEA